MFKIRSGPGESVAMETPLPRSASFESVSDSEKRTGQEVTHEKVCGGGEGGEKQEKVE